MIVEIEEDSRDFVTVYKKDYLGKKGKKPTERKRLLKYPPPFLNILNESIPEQYLNTRLEYQLLPEDERSEVNDLNRKCTRARDKFPNLRKVLQNVVLDENVIEREKRKSMKTVYQLSYSREFDEYCRSRLDRARKDVTLPQNWIIPETVQRRAYRNPWAIATRDLIKPRKILKPRSNLEPIPKEREILRITTGNSVYDSTIGTTGEIIVLQSLPDTKEDIGLRASLKNSETSESQCSSIPKQNFALSSRIF